MALLKIENVTIHRTQKKELIILANFIVETMCDVTCVHKENIRIRFVM